MAKKIYLKNYTSDMPISRSIAQIEGLLTYCGVKTVTKHFGDNGELTALFFVVPTGSGRDMTVRLPAKTKEAAEALWLDYKANTRRPRKGPKDFIEQGERTAWKLVLDWTQVQMSYIVLKQADVMEVFMAYAWDGSRTYYEAIKSNGFKGLLAERI
jgi:hypothetical protein